MALLTELHRRDLKLLTTLDPDALLEFASMAHGCIKSNLVASKGLSKAASRLGVTPESIDLAIKGLCFLFLRAAALGLAETDFQRVCVAEAGLSSEGAERLANFYAHSLADLAAKLQVAPLFEHVDAAGHEMVPCFRGLEWRLQMQVASRSVKKQAHPSYLLEVHTSQGGQTSRSLLESDYATLKNVCQQLEAALAELKSPVTRKIVRSLA